MMKATAKEAVRLWRVAEERNGIDIIIRDGNNDPVVSVFIAGYTLAEARKRAKRLVRDHNNYKELVDALDDLVFFVSTDGVPLSDIHWSVVRARAALTEAMGAR